MQVEILNELWNSLVTIFTSSGFATATWENYVMILIACVLFYLAIKKQFEPLLLLPIAFGMLLVNLYPGIMAQPSTEMVSIADYMAAHDGAMNTGYAITVMDGVQYYNVPTTGGLFWYLYQGVKLGIYPPLIFLGVGAMTDFGPLIANPKSFILGAAAQLGIFITFIGAILLGFTTAQAGSIGIIGGADGPTAIFVPIIQPPIMKMLTTKKERMIVMTQLRPVSKLEKVIFPIIVTIVISLLLPDAASLVGMLMLGNLMKESGVVDRIAKTAQNELMNIITIFLGTTVGATATGTVFLSGQTLGIIVLGLFAFCCGTAGGVLMGKLMCKLSGGKINPLIGSAGVSAVPMAARVSQKVGQAENPANFLLMHAMGPNVAGVIGSAVAAGVLISILA